MVMMICKRFLVSALTVFSLFGGNAQAENGGHVVSLSEAQQFVSRSSHVLSRSEMTVLSFLVVPCETVRVSE